MRKIYRQLILACLMISLVYCAHSILTSPSPSPVVSSVVASSERRSKYRPYGRFVSSENPSLNARNEPLPAPNFTEALLQETPRAEGHPILFQYLKQLNPIDKNELQTVLNVAAEARLQLLSDQALTVNSMEHMKQYLSSLTQTLDGDFAAATFRYLDNLDRRRVLQKEKAFHEEEIQGWILETGSGFNRTRELSEANSNLQLLQSDLDALQWDLDIYEARLANADTRVLLGPQYHAFCERLEAYKKGLADALDQDVIIEKFDTIFAALSSVNLEEI